MVAYCLLVRVVCSNKCFPYLIIKKANNKTLKVKAIFNLWKSSLKIIVEFCNKSISY